jgi:rSAM/selenodomain-associated transferase 1
MDADSQPGTADSLLLIQFARSPREGRVKTRMIPYLSPADACDLHCELTLWTCRQLLESGLGDVELSVAGDMDHPLFQRCRELGVTRLSRQRGKDLGERMYTAIREGLASHRGVILVGSDCPGVDAAYLRHAACALREAPLVLGPATDGGYVLIGTRAIEAGIFRDIPWGTGEVYARTRAALQQTGTNWAELPPLTDIDRPDDLPVWEALKRVAAT